MSFDLTAIIDYNVPFEPINIERVLNLLNSAVADNWSNGRDEWSDFTPGHMVAPEECLIDCYYEKMSRYEIDNQVHWMSKSFIFSYSPVSSSFASITFFDISRRNLKVLIRISGYQQFEVQGERRRQRMERESEEVRRQRGEVPPYPKGPDDEDPSYDAWWQEYYDLEETPAVWPQNKRCFQHIIAQLRTAFPVREIKIDKALQDGEAT